MNADPFTSGPQPESIETASDSKQQASSSGQVDLGSTRLEPDMLQSMQWVTSSSGYGSAGGQQSEHWSQGHCLLEGIHSRAGCESLCPDHTYPKGSSGISVSVARWLTSTPSCACGPLESSPTALDPVRGVLITLKT